jgi:hypothetical protein
MSIPDHVKDTLSYQSSPIGCAFLMKSLLQNSISRVHRLFFLPYHDSVFSHLYFQASLAYIDIYLRY